MLNEKEKAKLEKLKAKHDKVVAKLVAIRNIIAELEKKAEEKKEGDK